MTELRNQQVLAVYQEAGTPFHIRFGKASEGGKLPTSGGYLVFPEGGERDQSSLLAQPCSISKEVRVPTGKQECSWYLPEARRAGTTSKVTSGIRKDKKAVAPRQARQVGRWECSDFGIPS